MSTLQSHLMICPLTIEDTAAYIDHLSRNLPTSGVGNTPIFWIQSRKTPVDAETRTEQTRAAWEKKVDQPGWERGWGAWDDNRIVGAITLTSGRALSRIHRVSLGMGIEAGFRHSGMGRRLVSEAIAWATKQPFLKWIDLSVFAHNGPARRLYESVGFIESGRTTDCFRIDEHSIDDIQMVLDIAQLR